MSTALLMLVTLAAYFVLLLVFSRRWSRRSDNEAFFRAGRCSPWPMVAIGMVGASVSGVSFVSVPGWAASTQMTYLQMCAGFFVGYLAVAFVLLPLYYKLGLTSIYSYLGLRYGSVSRRTGAACFLVGKLLGAAARLSLVCAVLHHFVGAQLGIPFSLTAAVVLLLIWGYTHRGGMHVLVRTDVMQTLCLLLSMGTMLWVVADAMQLDAAGIVRTVRHSEMSRVFEWDVASPLNFWRQFVSGIFVVVVMTGLDQDMMQKNLTCRSLRDAQKDMCAYGACFLPVNLLLLVLGILLYVFCSAHGITPPASGDALIPTLVSSGALGTMVVVPFTLGVVAAAFSSADSAITSLTTTACIDVLDIERRNPVAVAERLRRRMHGLVFLVFYLCILAFHAASDGSLIDTIYVMVSYTYGPLLGLYAYGLLSRRAVRDAYVPWVALVAPLVCAVLDYVSPRLWGYTFGYELLMLNGGLTMLGLWCLSMGQGSVKSRTTLEER